MYTQIAFVTSVRGITFLPQIAANASLSFFGAKMPFPAFFMAVIFFNAALVMVVFVVVVVVVISIGEGRKC